MYIFISGSFISDFKQIVLGMGGESNSCPIVLSTSSMAGDQRGGQEDGGLPGFIEWTVKGRIMHSFSVQNLNLIALMNRWRMKR